MGMTPKNLVKHEIIGLTIRVIKSTDPEKAGLCGTVDDETKNIIHIKTKTGVKKVPKGESTFLFTTPNGEVEVDGKKLIAKPEDRIKKSK